MLIAHNIDVSYNVLTAEVYRMDRESEKLKAITTHCIMRRGSAPNEKWYRLYDLYQKYYHNAPLAAHTRIDVCKSVYMYQFLKTNM
jgi:hypothetical protein